MYLERDTQQEDNQKINPDDRIDSQQHTETTEQQDDPGSGHRQLGRRCPPGLCVLAHIVEILEVIETGHQPITAKNDPSDQESDIHPRLLSFCNFGCITGYLRSSTSNF